MARPARENVRDQILQAAEKRLWHYGYKKTTIDEIAADASVGKGTVYLHFESKEDIYSAIVGQFKGQVLAEQEEIARSDRLSPLEKLRQFLKLPVLMAHRMCAQSPQAMEMIVAIKPQLAERLKPLMEREAAMLTQILIEGNERQDFAVADPPAAAKTLKLMTLAFLPPDPHRYGDDPEEELDRIIDLAYQGLKKR